MATLIGDRFLRVETGWHDVVTGEMADVRVGPAPHDVAARARLCAERFGVLTAGVPRLIDFGPIGQHVWFEARERVADVRVTDARFSLRRIERGVVSRLRAMAAALDRPGPSHTQLVMPRGAGRRVLLDDIARALRELGFVTLRADAPLPTPLRRQLCHRHLALIVSSSSHCDSAAEWATRLCAASRRSHLMIELIEDEAPGDGESIVMAVSPVPTCELLAAYTDGPVVLDAEVVLAAAEQSGGWPGRFAAALHDAHARTLNEPPLIAHAAEAMRTWPFSTSAATAASPPSAAAAPADPTARLLARAAACQRQGRPTAAGRWLHAGLEASRRHGQPSAAVQALEVWVPDMIRVGQASRAASLASAALRRESDPPMRSALARLAAVAHLASGSLMRADACVETAACVEQLLDGHVSVDTLALRAQVRWWQGRCREARAELETLDPDRRLHPEIVVWRDLLAWADGDDRFAQGAARGAAGDTIWHWARRVLQAAAVGITADLDAALRVPCASPIWRPVIAAQAWLDVGDDTSAAHAIRESPVRPVATRGLADAAAAAIRRAVGRATTDELRWLAVVTSRERMRGLARWGQRRSSMQMLQDMATLFEVVQGCEDETVGMRLVCEWTAKASDATACAVASAPHGEVVMGAPLHDLGVARAHVATWIDHPAAKLEEAAATAHARAPIRYGGVVLGLVLGAAPIARARALFDAVQAAAAVSGPLLRALLDARLAGGRAESLAHEILGDSPAIDGVRQTVARAAMAPFSVVIEGESGTGKELVARALHRLGPRRDRPFAALNCAALTDELVEAELFGHARGAFTHAVTARAGLFEDAHQGTLFLDEVGDLSPRAQAKLLRVLQEGEIRRIGENESRAVDVRVIAATNRPLAALVAAGRFRDDLMFRLSVVRIQVPPLRERAGDVPALAAAFWRQAARRVGTRAVLGSDALAVLAGMPWPGNVRQLQNAMAAVSVAAPATGRVSARLVRHVLDGLVSPPTTHGEADIVPLEQARVQVERRVVAAALARHTGSRAAAASALGLSRQGLNKAMRRLGLAQAGVA